MNAADRQLLARLAEVTAAYVALPRHHIDRSLPSDEYNRAWDKAEHDFNQLQRDRAIAVSAHMEWLSDPDSSLALAGRIESITDAMLAEMAQPLPYPVKPAEVPA